MTAPKIDLEIEQGETYSKIFLWKTEAGAVINLAGYTGRMQIREAYDSPAFIIERTTENGGVVITGSLGKVELKMTDAQTSAIPEGDYVYDLELVSSGLQVTKFIKGSVKVFPEVTR